MEFYGSAAVCNGDIRAPVTEADRAANAAILEVLADRPAGDEVLSEEQADTPPASPLSAYGSWIRSMAPRSS